jgi:hypothetical protein
MADKADLLGSVLEYWQSTQQQAQAKPLGPSGVYAQTKQGLGTLKQDTKGLSPDDASKMAKSYGEIGKFSQNIDKNMKALHAIHLKTTSVMRKYGMSWKDSLKYIEKDLVVSKKLSTEEKSRHASMLSYLKQQQTLESEITKLQLKRQTVEKLFGKGTLASTMIGGGLPGGPGGESKKGLIAGGIMVGVASEMMGTLLDGMKKSFSGGVRGVFDAIGGTITKGVSAISTGLGGKVGGIIELVIEVMLFQYENAIALARSNLHALAQTGTQDLTTKATGGAQMFGMPRDMALSWKKAFADTGSKVTDEAMTQFTFLGLAMDYGADETGKMTSDLLSATGDIGQAFNALDKTFRFAADSANKTNINTDKWVKTLIKVSNQARSNNMGFNSVLNVMNNIRDSNQYLGAFGVDLRTQMEEVSSSMINAGKNWDLSMHAFVGTSQFGGKDIMENAYKSMFGTPAMKAMQITAAGTVRMPTKPGGGQFQFQDEDLLAGRLETMRARALEAGKGVENPYQKLEVERRMLDMMGIKDVGAQMKMLQEGVDFKKMAKEPDFKYAFQTPEEILKKTLSVADRTEQVQNAVKDILIGILGTLIAIGKQLGAPTSNYESAFKKYASKTSSGVKELKKAAKDAIEPMERELFSPIDEVEKKKKDQDKEFQNLLDKHKLQNPLYKLFGGEKQANNVKLILNVNDATGIKHHYSVEQSKAEDYT